MKKCSACGTVKPHSEFYVRNKARGVPHSCCKSCDKAQKKAYYGENRDKIKERTKSWGIANPDRRAEIDRSSHLKTKFGITPEDYDRMLLDQGGKCKICSEECVSGRRLAVDHCHVTGTVRGLLCSNCNTSLGGFKDSITLLENAIAYLNTHQKVFDTHERE